MIDEDYTDDSDINHGEPMHLIDYERDETYCGITSDNMFIEIVKLDGTIVTDRRSWVFPLTTDYEKVTCELCQSEYGLKLLANL